MDGVTRQQAKVARQVQNRAEFGMPKRMVRTAKPRARAGMENQEPKDRVWRLWGYPYMTPAQRRRMDHKAGTAEARARRRVA
jgi:hypothetical protein